ncbi:MAG: LysR substrate-binding domain-containing protein [Verrucomicrobiales bacterium]|nr:LysR substrate-binding domain-containing protein [Verrucomicrobiales bacterium]
MEFHQLRYFIAAAEELSVTAAAKRLHLSQPALSRQIQSLEEELGIALFDRIKKRIHLTDAGRFFLIRARQIVCDADTSVQLLQEQFGEAKPKTRLGFISIFLDDIVAPAVKAVRKQSHNLEISLHELSPKAQLDRLRDDQLDLALLGNLSDEDRTRYEMKCIMRSPMAAVLPDDHRLAKRKQIVLSELRGEPFVSLSDTIFPGRRQFLRSVCQSQGFEPNIVEESDSLSLLLGAVSTGGGVAILPAHSQKLPHAGSVFVHLKTPVIYAEVLAVYKPTQQAGTFTRLLIELEKAAGAI